MRNPYVFDKNIILEEVPGAIFCKKMFRGEVKLFAIVDTSLTGYMVTYADDWSSRLFKTRDEMISAVNRENRDIDERGFI